MTNSTRALSILLIFAAGPSCQYLDPMPADERMIQKLNDKRTTFEALRDRVCQIPGDLRITRTWSKPEVPDELARPFREILSDIGADGFQSIGECRFAIDVWSIGAIDTGIYKGYAYRMPLYKGDIVVPSLDEPSLIKGPKGATYVRKIDEDWSLRLDYYP